MVDPIYGGWVSFTGHLLWRDFQGKANLFKIRNKVENKTREFAFGLRHQNISKDALSVLDNQVVIALDKHNYKYTKHLTDPILFIHAMNEPDKKLLDFYQSCKRITTIRKPIQEKMQEMGVKCGLSEIPFYEYPITIPKREKTKAVSMARVEFRKRQDIICQANQILAKKNKPTIEIHGEANRMYVYHKLKGMDFEKWYKGRYAQDFNVHQQILADAKYLVNLTQVPKDGGSLEYTLLQAIYHDTVMILHRSWLETDNCKLKENYNCLAVSDEKELADLLYNNKTDYAKVTRNAKKLLQAHKDSKWV